jgi:hypothetical protein
MGLRSLSGESKRRNGLATQPVAPTRCPQELGLFLPYIYAWRLDPTIATEPTCHDSTDPTCATRPNLLKDGRKEARAPALHILIGNDTKGRMGGRRRNCWLDNK